MRAHATAWLLLVATAPAPAADAAWPHYGGDAGGTRYSTAAQITPANVDGLRRQWTYHTGDKLARDAALMRRVKFQTTPILVGELLVLCSAFNTVIALDPATGLERWRHDPRVRTDLRPANRYNCRGVAQWRDPQATPGAACAMRIYTGTVDARLIALDARNGRPCADFGEAGTVRIETGQLDRPGEYQISSAPVVADGVVIVGSAIDDNQRSDAPPGTVHAFDARSGRARWAWNPLAGSQADPAAAATAPASAVTPAASAPIPSVPRNAAPGAANVWAPISVDERRGLVFLPTSSPSPDFYGGARPGNNAHANSVAALRIADGTLAWAFQTVHHDVWDYDLAAQPTLTQVSANGQPRDAVVMATKQGFVFVLDRDTGRPLFPVEERPVPQGGAPGEALSPTQPFPTDLPALVPQRLRPEEAHGMLGFDSAACRTRIAALRNEGLYTPPSTQGTLIFPMTGGGVNWGGVAADPAGIVYVNTNRAAHVVRLIPRDQLPAARREGHDKEISPQRGTPFGMQREVLLSPLGLPCNPPPWGTLAALDLRSKRLLWEVPLGSTEDIAPLGLALATGTPNFGGPVATAGGLVFIGAAMDRYLRAFDAASGAELWRGRLPVPAMATPMTYEWQGRQYVVVAAGGHGELGTATGDAIVAFTLPAPGEAARNWRDRYLDQPGRRLVLGAVAATTVGACLLAAGVGLLRRRRRRALNRPGSLPS